MTEINYQFIRSNAEFSRLCESAAQCNAIALDTEFFRETSYFPVPALLQIFDGEQIYLVDPLAVDDFSAFKMLLQNHNVTKVVHSCSEDLDVFRRLCGELPEGLFDTQIAAAYCGEGFSLSYQNLVAQLLDRTISKDETRSDWLQRPLTARQCEYAAHDVRWLLDLHQHLNDKLQSLARSDWCAEDIGKMLREAKNPDADAMLYRRIKAATRLQRWQLNRLRALCAWRERTAREKDCPKGRIASDAALLELVQLRPEQAVSKQLIAEQAKLSASQVRRYGDQIVALIGETDSDDKNSHPSMLRATDLQQHRKDVKTLQKIAREQAENLGVPVELLARKRDIEEYLYAADNSVISNSWRKQYIGSAFDTATGRTSSSGPSS
jgi:ribonuclease D